MNPIVRLIRRAQVRANAPRIAANPNPYNVSIQTDIPYIDDGDPNHLLDVYSPDAHKKTLPVILEIHGGGYLSCSKEINAQHGQYLASKGFHVVNINYTLCPEGNLSVILNEVASALAWMDTHSERFGFDMSGLCVTGDSAGGHIALMSAAILSNGRCAEFFNVRKPPVRLAACGVSCPEGSFDWKLLPRNLSATMLFLILHKYTFDAEYVRHSSYEYYMDADYPRIWFCSSPTDSLLYTHTRGMHEYMVRSDIDHVYREYTSRERKLDHVFNILNPDYPESRQANDDLIDFFRSTLSRA